MERLLQGLRGLLRLTAVTLQTLLRCAAATLSGFDVLCGVSFAWGHGALLGTIVWSITGEKETMLSRVGIAKAGPLRTSERARRALRPVLPVLPVLPAFLSRVFAVHRARGLPLVTVCSRGSVLASAWTGGCRWTFTLSSIR